MNILSLVSYVFCAGSLLLGARILILDRRNRINIALFHMGVASGFSTFCMTLFYSAAFTRQAYIWHRLALIGLMFFPVILLRLLILLAPFNLLKITRFAALMYLTALFFGCALLIFVPSTSVYVRQGFWQVQVGDRALSYCYMIYYAMYMAAGILLCISWRKRAGSSEGKKRAEGFLFLLLFFMLLLAATSSLLFITGLGNMAHIIFLVQAVWFFSLLFIVSRNRVVSVFRVIDAGSIVNSMGDFILAVNLSGKIVEANESARRLLGLQEPVQFGITIAEVFCPKDGRAVEKILENRESFTYNCEYRSASGLVVPASGIVIPVRDKRGSIVGKIIIGRDDSRAAEIHRTESIETERIEKSLTEITAQNERLERFMKMTEGRDIEYNRLKTEANKLFERFNKTKRYTAG